MPSVANSNHETTVNHYLALFMDLRFPNPIASALLIGFSLTAGVLAFFHDPLPPDNRKAYDNCVQVHPERYCRFEYMPGTLKR